MALIENQLVKVKWNTRNKQHYEKLGYVFTKIGDEFEVHVGHLTKGSRDIVKYKCDYCGKILYRQYKVQQKAKHDFCDINCQSEFYKGNNHPLFNSREVTCAWCNKVFMIPNYRFEESKKNNYEICCSKECSTKLFGYKHRGENNPKWKGIVKRKCEHCGKEYEIPMYRIKRNRFCSVKCTMDNLNSLSETRTRWISKNKDKLLTKPQIIINKLLDQLDIKYENEKIFKYYSVDNYLPEFNLIIEVNGDYWHGNPIIYNPNELTISQIKSIKRDKAKHNFIKSNYNINILYLWEDQILNNIKICELLIKKYINNNGNLKDYNSFNYYIDKNNNLKINEVIINPYFINERILPKIS